ncbi:MULTISPECIES: hypothetical protein [unclassified Bradyrhizobium]|nr:MULTISPECIES: hypothetical protein [unclassified Bradyrhizobium]
MFASCFILAALFALDRSLPPLAELSPGTDVDRSVIRIRSARAWPEKIVLDTSTQIATTVSSPLLSTERQDDHAGQAFATATPGQSDTKIMVAPPDAVRATSLRSKRTARTASSASSIVR